MVKERGKYLIHLFVNDLSLDLADNFENVWFFVVVSVGADTEVNLVGISVLLVGSGGTEDDIWGSELKMSEIVLIFSGGVVLENV